MSDETYATAPTREENAAADEIRRRVDELIELAESERDSGNWRRLEDHCLEAEVLARSIGYELGRARSIVGLAFASYRKSEHKVALTQALEAQEILSSLNDRHWLATSQTVIFLVQWSLGAYDRALEAGLAAMKIFEEDHDLQGLAWCYTSAGGLLHDLGDFDRSLEYHQRSRAMFRDAGAKIGEARALAGIGLVYQSTGKLDEALKVQQESLELFRATGDKLGESRALNDIGSIYQQRRDWQKALEFHQASMALRLEEDNPHAQVTSLLNLGRVYLATRDHERALDSLGRALAMAASIGAKPKVYQAHSELSELYAARGDFERALFHHRAYHRVRDEVFSEQSTTRLRNLEISFSVEHSRKEAEIYRLRNIELATALDELQVAQASVVQSEKMAALGDLVASVAHEFNSPLGVILSFAKLNSSLTHKIEEATGQADREQLRRALDALREGNLAVASAAERLAKIVRSLKGFARLDEADFQVTDLRRGIDETLTLLEPDLRDRVKVVRDYGPIPEIECYASEMNQVFHTLLRNASQAIDGAGVITVHTWFADDEIHVEFADTGRGIPPDQVGRLFNPSFRKTGSRVEARMGLFAAYQVIRKHGGEIRVESQVGHGSRFTIVLPAK
jgi:signal transduction histidine kinase